jgi:nucleotide-binding universal stress UspA family protein
MSVKTILVHLANDPAHTTRLELALRFAKRYGGHVIALFIASDIGMPHAVTGRGASAAYLRAATESARKRAEELEAEFERSCEQANVSYDWLVVEGDHVELLSKHAHAADMIIVSQQPEEYLEDHFRRSLPEELVLAAGLPVLVLPRDYKIGEHLPGRRILVAWKGTREALRAVRDARPLMETAEQVQIMTVGPTTRDALSEQEIVRFLRRHGIEARAHNLPDHGGDTGQIILDFAHSQGADLIVAGAYGRSRLRELIMGGVSRRLMRDSDIPVLSAH